jgi:hypothetical protein
MGLSIFSTRLGSSQLFRRLKHSLSFGKTSGLDGKSTLTALSMECLLLVLLFRLALSNTCYESHQAVTRWLGRALEIIGYEEPKNDMSFLVGDAARGCRWRLNQSSFTISIHDL